MQLRQPDSRQTTCLKEFYFSLEAPRVPRGVQVMNPYKEEIVRQYVSEFADKFYGIGRPRVLVLGINPGRFGAGITGVTFTDPVALADDCGIPNHLPRRRELSSIFVYHVINHLGGPQSFYDRFFLSALCPLGFTKAGVNLNYYDDRKLEKAVTPFIVWSVERHIELGGRRDHVVILGRGKNAAYFNRLNDEHRWFDSVDAVDHPRFIMQYRRKRLAEYLDVYLSVLMSAAGIHGRGSAES